VEHFDFRIGEHFWTTRGEFRCTDVGTRTIVAVKIEVEVIADPTWLKRPPYAAAEYDLETCYRTAAERDADYADVP
jgi:hypothetical protein